MHHPVRRRKRRSHGVSSSASFSAIGVRSVDVIRGSNGFGFTISGQQPCLLSCIVAGSPAELAGLRPGHALVAVNGRSVARLPHDTVVRLIGSCSGTLRLHVSENYYPESSDSDIEDVDSYLPRRPAQGRAARVVRDLQSGAMFVEKTPPRPVISPPLQLPPRGVQNPPPPPPPSRTSPTDFRAVVGYLGTIELPKDLRPGSRLAVIRSCVRRMRTEKRVHTIVALTVRREQSVMLSDSLGTVLADFSSERVAFCGACADDKRFFGLVTSVSSVDEEEDVATACGGSSCHVFMIDPSLHPHHAHINRATAFRIQCTPSGDGCSEFPAIADPILRAVAALYNPNPSPPPPPPRSNTSSCPSSNSDSGIGFRDEILNSEDLSSNHHNSHQRLTVRAMPDPPIVILQQQQQQQMKLSPKVYGMPMLMAQSLEDIPSTPAMPSGDESMTSLEQHQWGSLQDLRKLESSPVRHRRRRKHPTHHQHPSAMPPPPLAMSTTGSQGNASLPSHTPQGSDEETDNHHKEGDSTGSRDLSGRSQSEGGPGEDVRGGPASCFDSFEKLLDDPNGMHAFSEFLKKEFSHENIYFWVACEKYRRLKELAARKAQARCIYLRHLAMGAPEPVNVDSQARQSAKDGLEEARVDLFLSAQKQIFNLMKFDSYPRFLKCDSYKESMEGPSVELDPDLLLHGRDEPNPGKLKKSRSDAEDRRRKSLLPWHRKNAPSRSKSRDRNASGSATGEGEEPPRLDDSSSVRSCSELTGSRSSLASSDLALIQRGSNSRQSLSSGDAAAELCRVILPDGATTVVPTVRGESCKQLIVRLLEKRGLHFSSFELFTANSSKPLVLSEDSSILSGKEVRVEQRVVFRLDLPSRKTVGVKAKAGRSLAEVLKPILHKYGYRLENTTVTLICDTEPLDPTLLITAVENQRLQVNVSGSEGYKEKCKSVPGVTLDEITNRVFEELLQGKTAEEPGKLSARQGALSDQGSVRSEDWSSEHSSGIFGRFLRRDSAFMDKTRESRSKSKKSVQSSKHTSLELDPNANAVPVKCQQLKPPPAQQPAKWKNNLKAHGRSESDELYEGLKRAQRSRLEDQRGTEINFELPDFLKSKEETPQARRMKKGRLTEDDCLPLMNMDGVDLSSPEGIIPNHAQAEAYFSSSCITPLRCSLSEHEAPSTLERTIIDLDATMVAPMPPLRHNTEPPPLPPKPKTFPNHVSKWNNNNNNNNQQQNNFTASEDEGSCKSQSTSSFV